MSHLLSPLLLFASLSVVGAQADGTNETEGTLQIRMCSCTEVNECRANSDTDIYECMNSCDDKLEEYGSRTFSYRRCFLQNKESVSEAENCLFETNNYTNCFWRMDWRRLDGQPIKIEQPNWSALTNVQYSASSQAFGNMVWYSNERKYRYMQGFLQCTKNCLLKKFQRCTERKECAPQLAAPYDFRRQRRECTKRNPKITLALFRTCQCLAWAKGVIELQGTCAVIGNQYYIDRA